MKFNRHLGFRVGFGDRFLDKFGDNFGTKKLQVQTRLKTPNMIKDRFGDVPKMCIELHPCAVQYSPLHRAMSHLEALSKSL